MRFCASERPASSNMLVSSGRLRLQPLLPPLCHQNPPEKGNRLNQDPVVATVAARAPATDGSDMTLRLVSSGDDRALAIRDHILRSFASTGRSKFNATPYG
jgi:hypothetical protein